jgi:hypothetical protein
MEAVRVCVHRDGFPQFVDAQIVPETGDTVVIQENGVRRPLRTVAPNRGTSVTSRPWHIRGENVFYGGREYVAFGLPASMQPEALVPRGEYDGVSLYTARGGGNAPGSTTAPAELFLPLYPACTFQRYVPREIPVRG